MRSAPLAGGAFSSFSPGGIPSNRWLASLVLRGKGNHQKTLGVERVGWDGIGTMHALRGSSTHLSSPPARPLLTMDALRGSLTVEMIFDECDDEAQSSKFVKLWTRFAVMSKVRALTLHVDAPPYLCLDVPPFVSRHLRTIDLEGLRLQQNVLDFASCPALEDLKMKYCNITVEKISSHSLKHLSITKCHSNSDCRLCVSTPGIISLKLDRFIGKTPFLENMALLKTACVNLSKGRQDVCLNYYSGGVFCGANKNGCENCLSKNDGSSDFVLLGGISSAKHLELISKLGKV